MSLEDLFPEHADEHESSIAMTLMQFNEEIMAPLAAAVDGYRSDCLEREYSEEAAEQMAVEYHGYLLMMLGGGR